VDIGTTPPARSFLLSWYCHPLDNKNQYDSEENKDATHSSAVDNTTIGRNNIKNTIIQHHPIIKRDKEVCYSLFCGVIIAEELWQEARRATLA
jgi:hypothetical protein